MSAAAVLFLGPKLPAGSDPNFESYYSQALSYTTREPHRAMAMLELLLVPMDTDVYVNLDGVPENLRGRFAAGIEEGFALWRSALGDDFPFKLRFSGDRKAPIEIMMVDKIDDKYHQMGEMLITRRVSWSKRSHRAEIEGHMKISRFSSPGRHLTQLEIKHIVAHELGHAFGLDDAEGVRQIMGPVLIGRPHARVNADELERVKFIRDTIREDIETLNAPNARQLLRSRPSLWLQSRQPAGGSRRPACCASSLKAP